MGVIAIFSFLFLILLSDVRGAPKPIGGRTIELARVNKPTLLQPSIKGSNNPFATVTGRTARNLHKGEDTKNIVLSTRQKYPSDFQPPIPHSNQPSATPDSAKDTLPTRRTYAPRDASDSCVWSTDTDLNQLPDAVADAQAYATANWGSDWETMSVNPSSWPSNPAQNCFSTDTVEPAWNANPSCSTQNVTSGGTVNSGMNTASASVLSGDCLTSDTTTEQSSVVALGATWPIKVDTTVFGSPDIQTFEADLTNMKSSSTSQTVNHVTTLNKTVSCAGPAQVTFTVKETLCTAKGTAQVPVVFGGWVWFTYKEKKNGHWNWAVNMDFPGTSPIAHRTTNMQLSVDAQLTSYSDVTATCS